MKSPPPEWAIVCRADREALKAGYYWDQEEADRVIRFAKAHVIPKYTSGEFELFEWQKRWLMRLYGWRTPRGDRRFAMAILHVAKKNGKTLLVSIIAQYELICSRVGSPLVLSASTTKLNATQVFEQMVASIKRNRRLKKRLKINASEKQITFAKKDATYRAMSSDVGGAEGWNISCGIIDEAHAHESAGLFKAIRYGTSGRVDGLIVIISTAGDDLTHFYYDLLTRARNILSGADTDPTIMAEIYEVNEKDDLDSPDTWKKANPSLDLYPGFTSEKFRLDWESAKKDTTERLNFMRYRLNIFCRAEHCTWFDLTRWDACESESEIEEKELIGCECVLGLDGSQTTDPSSVTAVWKLPDGRYFARSWAWVASLGVSLREKSNKPRYQQFEAEGVMTITEGNLIDKEAIRKHILGMRLVGHKIKIIVMDPSGEQVFGSGLEDEGFMVRRIPQSFAEYTDPMKAVEAAILDKKLIHDGNSWLRWCVSSMRVKTNDIGQCRPVKLKSSDHIDGAVSLLLAWKGLGINAVRPSVYDRHGIEFLD